MRTRIKIVRQMLLMPDNRLSKALHRKLKLIMLGATAMGMFPATVMADYGTAVTADAPFLWLRMQEVNAAHTTIATNSGASGVNGIYLRTGGTGGSFADITSMSSTLDPAKLFNRSSATSGAFITVAAQGAAYAALSNFTIEFLFKPTSYDSAGIEAIYATGITSAGAVHLNFTNAKLELWMVDPRLVPSPAMTEVAPVGQWAHVAITYSTSGGSTTCTVYINGSVVGSPSVVAGTKTGNFNTGATIASWNGNSRFMNDALDEFAVYSNALSQAQVQAHFNSLPPLTPVPLQPAENAADVLVGTTLSWACAGTNGYEVSLWNGGVTQCASVATTRWDPPGALKDLADYSWQVIATNPYGSSTGGVWTFTTERAPAYIRAVATDDPFLWFRMQERNAVHTTVATNSGGSGVNGFYQQSGGTGGSFADIPSMAAALDDGKLFNRTSTTSGAFITVAAQGAAYAALSNFTIEFLFKPTSYDSTGLEAIYATAITSAGAVHLNFNSAKLELWMVDPRLVPSPAMTEVAPVGQWAHVAITYSTSGGSTTCTVYINGSVVGSPSVVAGTKTGNFNTGATIASWNGNRRQMDDALDEFAVYSNALSQAQVQAHYKALFLQGTLIRIY